MGAKKEWPDQESEKKKSFRYADKCFVQSFFWWKKLSFFGMEKSLHSRGEETESHRFTISAHNITYSIFVSHIDIHAFSTFISLIKHQLLAVNTWLINSDEDLVLS